MPELAAISYAWLSHDNYREWQNYLDIKIIIFAAENSLALYLQTLWGNDASGDYYADTYSVWENSCDDSVKLRPLQRPF